MANPNDRTQEWAALNLHPRAFVKYDPIEDLQFAVETGIHRYWREESERLASAKTPPKLE